MDPKEARSQLRERLNEIAPLRQNAAYDDVVFQERQFKTRLTIGRALGKEHVLTQNFVATDYDPYFGTDTERQALLSGLDKATSILNAAPF
jgi:hypothetical protein